MSFGSIISTLVLGPLELLFEFIYSNAYQLTGNVGLSIIALSLAMNFLVLPLYKRADAMQEEERALNLKMKPGVDHIKKTFKGDERFMMLQTYNRQNNYKPYHALKGSLSLLLEIPFFIAAYRFLSDLPLLEGAKFGPIQNLGAPDALLSIGSLTVNVLPVIMTLINIISGAIYTKGMPLKSKIQLYGMALIFLALLYTSPSGLVFYWTLNNIFSLLKNIFLIKLKNPKRVLYCIFAAAGAGFFVWCLVDPVFTVIGKIVAALVCAALSLPLVINLVFKGKKLVKIAEATRTDKLVFYTSAVFLTLFTGLLIPSAVINASPLEFVSTLTLRSPLVFVLSALLLAAGTFLIWFTVFFKLASPTGKRVFAYAVFALALIAVINYMFFGKGYGTMSPELEYDGSLSCSIPEYVINTLLVFGAIGTAVLVVKKLGTVARTIALAACLAVGIMSAINVFSINSDVKKIREGTFVSSSKEEITLPLQKDGQNVVVIMLDRAISGFVPYLIEEKPELKTMFSGFTYYPNTISYGAFTNIGTPPLYGGYEYIPEKINARTDATLEQKQNEALKVMPVTFLNGGYDVTVCDPSYAGYSWIPDLTVFDEYPEMKTYITNGKKTVDWYKKHDYHDANLVDSSLMRNFFCYSVFRSLPIALHPITYNSGQYNEMKTWFYRIQTADGPSKAKGLSRIFMDSYAVLEDLKNMTEFTCGKKGAFIMMSNDTTHEPALLSEPDYTPAIEIDNTKYDKRNTVRMTADGGKLRLNTEKLMSHYHVNMAALLKLGEWFDYLRENGVYDNTRIIIVSDHGRNLGLFDMEIGDKTHEDLMWYNALLLVKDFNSTGFTTDYTFMTNADTPTLAFEGLFESPVNPTTGNAIDASQKNEPEQHIAYSSLWDIKKYHGNKFEGIEWLAVENDYFNKDGWRVIGGELEP